MNDHTETEACTATSINPESHRNKAPYFLRMYRAMPMPTPRAETEDEVFGPFEFEGGRHFWIYDGDRQHWSPIEARQAIEPLASGEANAAQTDEDRADTAALAAISELPPPDLPASLDQSISLSPFWHQDYRFCWVFLQHVGQWQLAIHEDEPA